MPSEVDEADGTFERIDGVPAEVEVHREYLDDRHVGWIARFVALDPVAQDKTRDDAVGRLGDLLLSWAALVVERFDVHLGPDRRFMAGVHIKRPKET